MHTRNVSILSNEAINNSIIYTQPSNLDLKGRISAVKDPPALQEWAHDPNSRATFSGQKNVACCSVLFGILFF